MQEVLKFLGDVNTPFAVATVANGEPKVRFFSFNLPKDDKIYFITSNKKDIFRELSQNPRIEICTLPNQEQEWVRIKGEVKFDNQAEIIRESFEKLPLLTKAYGGEDSKDIAMFYLDHMEAYKYGMAGKKERLV